MNCVACGAELLPNAIFCSGCGASVGGAVRQPPPPPIRTVQTETRSGVANVLLGFLLIGARFFTLPFSFVADTFRLLARIGERGSVEESVEADLPFISWFIAAGRVFVVASALLGFLALVVAAIASGGGEGLLLLLVAILGTFFWIWFWALIIEETYLALLVVRNTRRSAEALERRRQPAESGSAN